MAKKKVGRKRTKKIPFGTMTGRLRRKGYSKKSANAIAGAIRMRKLGKYTMKPRKK
jgi:hypothetical protein